MLVKWMNEQTKRLLSATDEAFFGFLCILTGIMVLSTMLWVFDGHETSKDIVRILETVMTGFMTIAGMGAQAVFRHSQTDKDLAAAAKATAEKLHP